MTWALASYLVAVAVGVGLVGRSAADTPTGIGFGLAFLLAAGVVLVTFWRFSERVCGQQEEYRRELFDAEIGALARLKEAGQIREDLIASVSHEFRTPLTAIRGSAATLLARADQICPDDRATLLRGVVEHSDRLSRLLEDMLLAASSAAMADAGAVDGGEVLIAVGYVPARQEDPRRLFEPFGSRESARTGRPTSLALYVVRRLVEAHGGRTTAVRDGAGIWVRVGLRALRPAESAAAAHGPATPAAHGPTADPDADPEHAHTARAASG